MTNMKLLALRVGTCLGGLVLVTASTFAAVTDLRLSKSGADVVLTWSTGASTFRVFRSETAVFMSGNGLVAQGLSTAPASDPAGLLGPRLTFYQVLGSDEPDPPLYGTQPTLARSRRLRCLCLSGSTPKTTMGSVRRWVGPTSPGP